MSKNTPTQWFIESGGARIIQTTACVISANDGLGPVAYSTTANAKLIAAAPTMSATLKRAAHVLAKLPQEQQTPEMLALRSNILDAIELSTPEYYGLNAAIKKAEGKA